MNEADRPLENHEHALSPDELARLRRLLNGSPTNRIEPPDPYKNRNEAGLQSINSRLDLTQKAFAAVSLVAMACIGYLFLKSTDVADFRRENGNQSRVDRGTFQPPRQTPRNHRGFHGPSQASPAGFKE